MSLKSITEPVQAVCDLYAERCGTERGDDCRRFGIDPDEAIRRKWLIWLEKAA